MKNVDDESRQDPIAKSSDPTLQRFNVWATAAPMLEMWKAHAAHVSDQGELREMFIQPGKSENGVVKTLRVSMGIKPKS